MAIGALVIAICPPPTGKRAGHVGRDRQPRSIVRPVLNSLMLFRLCRVLTICVALLAAGVPQVAAQSAANVLVVANEALPASVEIAEYYVQRRQVPSTQLLKIRTSVADQVTRLEYDFTIQQPIQAWLAKNSAQDRILYIVLTKGVPLRIAGSGGRAGTISSVDSELTLLYRRMTGRAVAPHGQVANPYFLADEQPSAARRFSHSTQDIYLVTRLDGFTVDDVKALIDRASASTSSGKVVLDQLPGPKDKPNEWLAQAAKRLEGMGLGERVILEQTSRAVEKQQDVLGYYSWGSNDPALLVRSPGVEFEPGALAAMFVSTDARTFTPPPENWKPGNWASKQAYHAGSPQSLTGDLVRAGITGVVGYVSEPYLDTAVRPDILFPAYFSGFTLAESFYLALPALSWQGVIIGDPLCRPFGKTGIAQAELDPALDKETELPLHFSGRRLTAPSLKGEPSAVKLLLKAEARLARDDRAAARQALEEAVTRDPLLIEGWRALGTLYDLAGEPTKAIAAYRKVIERNPKDAVALNNLAYTLAVHEKKFDEALKYGERALLLEPRSATVADTVGWIKHLLGDDAGAIKLLAPAAKVLRTNVDVQLHAAVVYAALGRLDEAAAALKAAEAVNPAVKDRAEYREAQQKIGR